MFEYVFNPCYYVRDKNLHLVFLVMSVCYRRITEKLLLTTGPRLEMLRKNGPSQGYVLLFGGSEGAPLVPDG